MGYGSGKTKTSVMEVIKHVMSTPHGTTLMGAATLPQLEQTSMKEFFESFPKSLIAHYSKQKNYVDTINGHRILFRPLYDDGNIRSLNLSCFHIEEASEVDYSIFVQLQTRLRSEATKHHLGILSSNPDIGWIRSEFLLKSDNIVGATENYLVKDKDVNPAFSSHIAETRLNKYLPKDFYDTTARGKPDWWIKRYLEGSFSYSEGMVYPMIAEHIIKPFEIPNNWERFIAADFGLRDPTVFLLAAVDPKTGTVYIYDEHYESNKPVSYHAQKFHDMTEHISPGLLRQPVGDPAGKQRSKNDLRSLFNHYAEYDIHFKAGNNRIEDGIQKVYTYLVHSRLKFFSSCANTVREGTQYKYKLQELEDNKNADEKPIDKDDHTMDTLRYLIQELPDNPDRLVNRSFNPRESITVNSKALESVPFALQDDEDDSPNDWYYNYY